MGRELQKKKNKSSIPKLRHKQPSKKKILQNPIIAANWYVRPAYFPAVRTDKGLAGIRKKHSPRTTPASVSLRASIMPPVVSKRRSKVSASTMANLPVLMPPPAAPPTRSTS
jgi:nucleolar protein 16